MTEPVPSLLQRLGPSRSSRLVDVLVDQGASREAARQAVSRSRGEVKRLSALRLRHNESFVYLPGQFGSEAYAANLRQALADTGSVYSWAVESLAGRGGAMPAWLFHSKSGSPLIQKGHVPSERVLKTLHTSGLLDAITVGPEEWVQLPDYPGPGFVPRTKAILLAEDIVIAAVHKWATNLGLSSYKSTTTRNPKGMPSVGRFEWDVAGPSYLAPFQERGRTVKPGFLGVDVTLGREMASSHVQFALKKGQTYSAPRTARPLLQILVSDWFAIDAQAKLKAAGIIAATPSNLFGQDIGKSLADFISQFSSVTTVRDADKALKTLDALAKLDGTAGQIRGPLFELVVFAAMSESELGTVKLGVQARDPSSGDTADIDVLCLQEGVLAQAIECKGRLGPLDLSTAKDWLQRQVPRMRAYLTDRYPNTPQRFELWTTGELAPETSAFLDERRRETKKYEIGWKVGPEVLAYCDGPPTRRLSAIIRSHFHQE